MHNMHLCITPAVAITPTAAEAGFGFEEIKFGTEIIVKV